MIDTCSVEHSPTIVLAIRVTLWFCWLTHIMERVVDVDIFNPTLVETVITAM